MYLKQLKVLKNQEIIRDIKFKSGLNLIVDTTTDRPTDSGNNVGKTTFLRLIDYCLGGNKKKLYTDSEFKKTDKLIYDFLTTNNITVELAIESTDGTNHVIKRSLDNKGNHTIDGRVYAKESDLKKAIQTLLFGYSDGKPTLSQLMKKFIRIEPDQMTNALKFLHKTTTDSEYESLFMVLFGYSDSGLLDEKIKTADKIKTLDRDVKKFDHTVENLEQQLSLIDNDIKSLSEAKRLFNFSPTVDKALRSLKQIQADICTHKTKIAQLNLRLSLNETAVAQLAQSKSSVNQKNIDNLYKQASNIVGPLKKKFETVLQFHNTMVDNKMTYLRGIMAGLKSEIATENQMLETKLKQEATIVRVISNQGALGEYDSISLQLEEKHRQKGNREGLIETLNKLVANQKSEEKKLEAINKHIEHFFSDFKKNITAFNRFFSDFSKKLYNENYYLSPYKTKNTNSYSLSIDEFNENIGTGKKKAQIAALDLAYLKYSESCGNHMPRFVIHDQLETIFENQIDTLFEIANALSGQFIVAVLSDKLYTISPETVQANCILSLSQTDRFFRVAE